MLQSQKNVPTAVPYGIALRTAGSSSGSLLYTRTYTYLQPNASLYPNLFCVGSVIEHDARTNKDYTTTYVYNNKGRVIQKTDPAGISTVYIWGYGGLYPVAEVVGARLIDVISNVSGLAGIVSFSLPGALSDSQVGALQGLGDTTVWEYAPLVGLTKETTPDGRSTSYTYNASGKLHQILDDLGRKTAAYLYSPDNKQQ